MKAPDLRVRAGGASAEHSLLFELKQRATFGLALAHSKPIAAARTDAEKSVEVKTRLHRMYVLCRKDAQQ